MFEDPTNRQTSTFLTPTLMGIVGGGEDSGSDGSLIPVNPSSETKSLKAQTVFSSCPVEEEGLPGR